MSATRFTVVAIVESNLDGVVVSAEWNGRRVFISSVPHQLSVGVTYEGYLLVNPAVGDRAQFIATPGVRQVNPSAVAGARR